MGIVLLLDPTVYAGSGRSYIYLQATTDGSGNINFSIDTSLFNIATYPAPVDVQYGEMSAVTSDAFQISITNNAPPPSIPCQVYNSSPTTIGVASTVTFYGTNCPANTSGKVDVYDGMSIIASKPLSTDSSGNFSNVTFTINDAGGDISGLVGTFPITVLAQVDIGSTSRMSNITVLDASTSDCTSLDVPVTAVRIGGTIALNGFGCTNIRQVLTIRSVSSIGAVNDYDVSTQPEADIVGGAFSNLFLPINDIPFYSDGETYTLNLVLLNNSGTK